MNVEKITKAVEQVGGLMAGENIFVVHDNEAKRWVPKLDDQGRPYACVIGAIFLHGGIPPVEVVSESPSIARYAWDHPDAHEPYRKLLESYELNRDEADLLQSVNDALTYGNGDPTPPQRRRLMLNRLASPGWIRKFYEEAYSNQPMVEALV